MGDRLIITMKRFGPDGQVVHTAHVEIPRPFDLDGLQLDTAMAIAAKHFGASAVAQQLAGAGEGAPSWDHGEEGK